MNVKINPKIDKPYYMRRVIDKNMQNAVKKMAEEIQIKAKELEPTAEMKKSFFDKVRDRVKGN